MQNFQHAVFLKCVEFVLMIHKRFEFQPSDGRCRILKVESALNKAVCLPHVMAEKGVIMLEENATLGW